MTPPSAADHPPPGADTQPAPLDGHSLLAQLGREVAGGLSPALERVATLSATGRIDRHSLRALHDEVGSARRAGVVGQQLARLAQGRVSLTTEQVDLAALLQQALAQRQKDLDSRGIPLQQTLTAASVMSDAALLLALLQTALDWSFTHATARIDLRVELRDISRQARVRIAFPYHVAVAGDQGSHRTGAALDTLSWRLLEQAALVLGLALRRRDARGRTELVLDFPPPPAPAPIRTPAPPPAPAADNAADALSADAPSTLPGSSAVQPLANARTTTTTGYDMGSTAAPGEPRAAQALAGFHVLVLAGRLEVRAAVREALRDMDLLLDFVTSVDEARLFCAAELPHALVFEAAHANADFLRLRDALLLQRPGLGMVQITDAGDAFDVLTLDGQAGGRDYASVGRDGLLQSLPAALIFELFRTG